MDNWFEFILERYNYWIAITLMMLGLYIVFARGNLVKKIVGLNLFQTSVFIFYITIGKIAGGTAPIYQGEGAAESHGEGEGAGTLHEAPDGAHDNSNVLDAPLQEGGDYHSKIDNTLGDLPVNDLKSALKDLPPTPGGDPAASLHAAPADVDKIGNNDLVGLAKPEAGGLEFSGEGAPPGEQLHDGDIVNSLGDAIGGAAHGAASGVGDIVYSNPLPHVLILTAIVVGVATTAVGLALAVRIREAYGAIEEDELEAIDNIAEFGDAKAGAA